MPAGRKHSIVKLAAAAMVLLAFAPPARAQHSDLEPAVKATFVTRFASFVQWPPDSFADAAAPVTVCVVGDRAFASQVEAAARGERVGAHPIAVRAYSALPRDAACHVLFAAGTREQSVAQLLQAVAGQPVLTVTDERRGRVRGMVHFVRDRGRVRFRIDRDAADAARLIMNSRLLAVALSVDSRRLR